MVDHVDASGTPTGGLFAEARRLARRHYQWAVLTDFVPRICGRNVIDSILKKPSGNAPIRCDLHFYKPKKVPFMPVEFSVAAYRFGHSQIRPGYKLTDATSGVFFQPQAGERDLNGFRPLLPSSRLDWQYFFDIPGAPARPQRSMRIDAQISFPLFRLPFGGAPASLAERNLLRGKALRLPSGQAVALAMGLQPLSNAALGMSDDPGWDSQAPLWFYVLKEAELQHAGTRLGEVGAASSPRPSSGSSPRTATRSSASTRAGSRSPRSPRARARSAWGNSWPSPRDREEAFPKRPAGRTV